MIKEVILFAALLILWNTNKTMGARNRTFIREKRIIQGSDAYTCEFPSIVHLRIMTKKNPPLGCGGTLIDNLHVLTAAHCMVKDIKRIRVNFGTIHKDKINQVIDAKTVRVHPNHATHPFMRYDIAIITLRHPVNFTHCVQPMKLAEPCQTFEGKHCVTAGWGRPGWDLKSSPILQKVSLPIIDHDVCMAKMAYAHLSIQHICAGDFKPGGPGICKGDSGGPLLCPVIKDDRKHRFVLAGISSFMYKCLEDASVFTSVAHLRSWIEINR